MTLLALTSAAGSAGAATTVSPVGGTAAPSGAGASTAATPGVDTVPTTSTPTTATPAGAATPPASATTPTATSPGGASTSAAPPARSTPRAHRSGGLSTPAIVLAALGGLLVLGCLAWGLARMLAYEPRWLQSLRHALAEGGFRSSATWAEFSDWARLGR